MSITGINVQSKAKKVAAIFDTLAIVVLIVGVLGAVVAALFGVIALFNDGGFGSLMAGLFGVVGIAIYTALTWAGITLATIVAGYIAERSSTDL